MTREQILKKYFGYDEFRPMQGEVIDEILSGKDVLAIMPTGAGKSLCFQVPALMFPYGSVIISPLISLMKDQVEALNEQGISASYVNSTVTYEESIERLRELYRGHIKLLYMAPENSKPLTSHIVCRKFRFQWLSWTRRIVYRNGGMIFVRVIAKYVIL